MVRRMFRTRSVKRRRIRTPGGLLKMHFSNKKNSFKKCKKCGKRLNSKKASRIMSELCSKCLKKHLIEKVRGERW